jgi:RHS repeat-associated protein
MWPKRKRPRSATHVLDRVPQLRKNSHRGPKPGSTIVLPARPLLSRRTHWRNRRRVRRSALGRSVYNYFRDYDAMLGRYVQPDPIGLEGGLNSYLYAKGNPLRFVDATGESPAVAAAIVEAAIWGYRAYRTYRIARTAASAAAVAVGAATPVVSKIHVGSWPDSTTRANPTQAGEDAADEIVDPATACPLNSPEACRALAQRCTQKCIEKAQEGYGGPLDIWLARCKQACTNKLGCGNYFP